MQDPHSEAPGCCSTIPLPTSVVKALTGLLLLQHSCSFLPNKQKLTPELGVAVWGEPGVLRCVVLSFVLLGSVDGKEPGAILG